MPRWALSCYWRKDKEPIWKNQKLFADERKKGKATTEDANLFLKKLTERLAIPSKFILAGYEDVYYYLWKEGNLPINVDPFSVDLKDDEERKTLRKNLEKGLDKITGYSLPLKWNWQITSWETGSWFTKRERMYLIPGDSPMGYRLPLNSLPSGSGKYYVEQASTFNTTVPLNNFYEKVLDRYQRYIKTGDPEKGVNAELEELYRRYQANKDLKIIPDAWDILRTALVAEPRNGNLYLFLPPLTNLEEYLDLISSIELTAEELNIPVIIEGYQPPNDVRLQKFQITPDPGVIEVNIHPVESWEEMVKNTEVLYEQARLCKLAAEKFMQDGRHTGTGGGNHITLGGKTAADSPVLRRPDLLRSMLSYWHNHPSLSYLFSGLFVGPTSQAPRFDEARNDSTNEIEIAFRELDKNSFTPLWLVDRLFRNLLTDLTGNTHRAEFCIDKLYSPDSNSGRLGILEMRAFEMPPHQSMSLAQMLLIRSLVSKFWKNPYKTPMLRHDTTLHDKYMLPHFIWRDFEEVISDLNLDGYAFDKEWYKVFLDFRFPIFGSFNANDIQIEIRMAVEPWNVLGEEGAAGGMARYVDSAVERVQIKAFGLSNKRYKLTCNQREIPIQSTGIQGEFVGGVKYKAWQPPSGLHPTIPIHSPLIFDIYDTWNNRSVGGCVYNVFHPGGRGYTDFPINSNAAESRRLSRFNSFGHSPNLYTVFPEMINPDFPYTLDLRK